MNPVTRAGPQISIAVEAEAVGEAGIDLGEDAAFAQARAALDGESADVVILGGAALAGLAARIQPSVPIPVLCSVEAGTRAAIAAASSSKRRVPPPPALDSVGLGPDLAKLLGQAKSE